MLLLRSHPVIIIIRNTNMPVLDGAVATGLPSRVSARDVKITDWRAGVPIKYIYANKKWMQALDWSSTLDEEERRNICANTGHIRFGSG